jgi:pyrophosphate--fructose-6-phosphate 1-phosphotransferase
VDNDVVPIKQSLGAVTAAEQGAIFFENIANERNIGPRMLIVHEVMGRHCGWLAAATAKAWRSRLAQLEFLPSFGLAKADKDIDAVYVPELAIDFEKEAARLKKVMDAKGCVTIFVSEGAYAQEIVKDLEARGEKVDRDAFGHVKLDKINVGDWFGKQMGKKLNAEKTLIQKSGYFARSAAANEEDRKLIRTMAHLAVDCGMAGQSGVIGHDEGKGGELRAIEFERIKGGKAFDVGTPWFHAMLRDIGQV